MKYWLLPVIGIILGLGAGYATTAVEFTGNKELFLVYFQPPNAEPGETIDLDIAPKANVVNGMTYDFGAMEKNETESHAFIFRNEGQEPLTLKTLSTTCKCTLSSLEKETLQPGEETEVVLEWKPANYSRSFSQTAKIKTNDPVRDIVELRVKGRVIQPAWSDPETVVFTSIPTSQGAETEFFVFGRDEDFEITDWQLGREKLAALIDVSYKRLPADAPELAEQSAGSGYKLNVKVEPGLPLEPLMETVEIATNLEAGEPMEIALRGSVRGDIFLATDRSYPFDQRLNLLEIGLVPPGVEREATVRLMVRGEQAGKIKMWLPEEGVKPAGSLTAEIGEPRQLGNLQMFPLRLRIPEDAEPVSRMGPDPQELGVVKIETDHPIDKQIVIYVKFAAQGK